MATLLQQLIDKTCYFRETAPVFRVEERSVEEMETAALRLAARVVGDSGDGKAQIARREDRSEFLLAEGVRASVFHASGAVAVKTALAPMDHLIARADKEAMTKATVAAAQRIGIDQVIGKGEQLLFERLWQIKATGMTNQGERGDTVVCRAVGAFRRYLYELPVWGRASAFVEIAGDDRIAAVGLDWRPLAGDAIDHVKINSPEQGARAVLSDLNGRLAGTEFSTEDFTVGMFGLGYLSLPKRRVQTVFAPVYVAMLERLGLEQHELCYRCERQPGVLREHLPNGFGAAARRGQAATRRQVLSETRTRLEPDGETRDRLSLRRQPIRPLDRRRDWRFGGGGAVTMMARHFPVRGSS
jgi:hypothetical protein